MKITKFCVLFFLLFLMWPAMAQDGRVTVDLGRGQRKLVPFLLRDGTFAVLVSFEGDFGKGSSRMLYCLADGKQLWDKTVDNKYGALVRNIKGVAAPSGAAAYTIEYALLDDPAPVHQITRFSREGEMQAGILTDGTSHIQTIFCDDQYLYYVTTLNGKELRDSKKDDERLILNRVDPSDFSGKKFQFDVPVIENGETTTFWTYIGQHGSSKYLLSKVNDIDKGQHSFNILTFDQDANILNSTKIDLVLDNRYVRPALAVSYPGRTFETIVNPDFKQISLQPPMGSPPGIAPGAVGFGVYLAPPGRRPATAYRLTEGAYTYLYLDEEHGFFYVYGLSGPEPFKRLGSVYDGFYILKYTLAGELVWKLQQPASPELLKQIKFRVHNAPNERNIAIKILHDQTVNFSIQFSGMLFTSEVSPEGKFLRSYPRVNYSRPVDMFVHDMPARLRGVLYAEQKNKNLTKVDYTNFLTPAGELLLEHDEKKNELNVLYFKTQK